MSFLDGKVAVVTGAGGGIGREHALALARSGAAVVVNDMGGGAVDGSGSNQSPADQVVVEIKAFGGDAVANYCDVTADDSGERLLDVAKECFGSIDVLVNNAGILRDKSFHKMELKNWLAVMDVHTRPLFCVTQPIFGHMRAAGGGVIINTVSPTGMFGQFGQSNYGAAKGVVFGFTNCLAAEGLPKGVRVYAISPFAHSRMTANLKGAGGASLMDVEQHSASKISPLVVYLASDKSAKTVGSGKIFAVGGGHVAELQVMNGPGVTFDGEFFPSSIQRSISEILIDLANQQVVPAAFPTG